jgi:hypothetical protein
VVGDLALLETEMNDVLSVVKDNGLTVTGIHNHMINEEPRTSFMRWEAMGDINEILNNANEAVAETSIRGYALGLAPIFFMSQRNGRKVQLD